MLGRLITGFISIRLNDRTIIRGGLVIMLVGICVLLVPSKVAVLPGLSRSGSTIATGLLLGVKKEKAAQFSFLMVIPPILGEALLDILKSMKQASVPATEGGVSVMVLAVGFLAAFISGCLACKWMLSLVKKGKLIYFAVYCALLGSILLASTII